MYKYIQSEPGLWTVGFYNPNGKWEAESDHDTPADAADRVIELNGGEGKLTHRVHNLEQALLAFTACSVAGGREWKHEDLYDALQQARRALKK